MALITCKECGKDISDQAAACPGCGAPVRKVPAAPVAPKPQSLGDKKVGCGTTVVVVGLVGLLFLAYLVNQRRSDLDPVADAMSAMRRQVASDIQLTVDPAAARLYDPPGKMYYVCGDATLNHPDAGELTLNNVTQRYIVTMNDETRNGVTLFDGSKDAYGQKTFQFAWRDLCSDAALVQSRD